MSTEDQGKYKSPADPIKEQIAQDKFGKSYDELTAHERIQVGGTKGGITTAEGDYGGSYTDKEGQRKQVPDQYAKGTEGGGGTA